MQAPEWLEWKYDRNPHGHALSFKVLLEGRLVGAASLQPRSYRYRGREITGFHLVDGLLCKEVRGRKHFRELTAFLMGQTPPGARPEHFHYTVPSVPASVKACANAGLRPLGAFDLFTYVVHPGVIRRVRGAAWTASVLRPMWRAGQEAWLASLSRGVVVREIERFEPHMIPPVAENRVYGDRSADFLNWRTFDNPKVCFRAFLLHEGTGPVGYVVVKTLGQSLEIVDLRFVAPRVGFMAAFLRYVATKRIAEIVDCGLLPGHPLRRLLRRLGFLRRRSPAGVFYVHDLDRAGLPGDPALWEVSYLDSDW